MIALEVIEDRDRLRNFEPEWIEFTRRRVPDNPFQRCEWLMTWWSHFGSGAPRVMVFRHGQEMAGILPCFLHEWNGRRQMTLQGSGVSDYLDPLFDSEHAGEIVRQIRTELARRADWDLCDWQDLSRGTPLACLGEVIDETPCSAITIDQPFDAYFAGRPKDLKRNLRGDRRKAEATGYVTFEAAATADPELLDALIELHGARWARLGQAGMIESNGSEPFLRDVAERFAASGGLRFFALRFAGRIVAVVLAFCGRTTIFGYLSAFDPRYEEFGFGRELLLQALRYGNEHGYRRWDFLRGEEPYKFSWGAERVEKCRVLIRPACL
ncbi:MAG TPA: GNAT family N-acetyltransferase [Bryobacteraceae bacterium]|nr:GNAT family N-acetyltransferase [Bryobacteraceae bacterium]